MTNNQTGTSSISLNLKFYKLFFFLAQTQTNLQAAVNPGLAFNPCAVNPCGYCRKCVATSPACIVGRRCPRYRCECDPDCDHDGGCDDDNDEPAAHVCTLFCMVCHRCVIRCGKQQCIRKPVKLQISSNIVNELFDFQRFLVVLIQP